MAKGQGISINVIVIAAIALLILVILSTLVIRSSRQINDNTQSCEAVEGSVCVLESDGCDDGYIRNPSKGCPEHAIGEPQVCCTQL